jgi:hypothetical protein
LALTSAEADAYCADFLEEKSLRAGVARVLLRLVAVCARITTEIEELKRSEHSPSIWKLHADSLLALLEVTRAMGEHATRMTTLTGQHGSKEEASAIQKSVRKLHDSSEAAVMILTGARLEKGAGASAH